MLPHSKGQRTSAITPAAFSRNSSPSTLRATTSGNPITRYVPAARAMSPNSRLETGQSADQSTTNWGAPWPMSSPGSPSALLKSKGGSRILAGGLIRAVSSRPARDGVAGVVAIDREVLSTGTAPPLPCFRRKAPPAPNPPNSSTLPPGQITRALLTFPVSPSPKCSQRLDCDRNRSPARTDLTDRTVPAASPAISSTTAPMALRLHSLPSRSRATESPGPVELCEFSINRRRGAVRSRYQRSRSPSWSQSTTASARPSPS